jgi:hypothetical protein
MNNEIPHINPSNGYAMKRYYRDHNIASLTEPEREMFDCSEFICGKLTNIYILMMISYE